MKYNEIKVTVLEILIINDEIYPIVITDRPWYSEKANEAVPTLLNEDCSLRELKSVEGYSDEWITALGAYDGLTFADENEGGN